MKQRSRASIVAVVLLIALVSSGCASMSSTTQDPPVGGGAIGAATGAVVAGGVAEVSRRASIEAANSQRPVSYRTVENGRNYTVQAEPVVGGPTIDREQKCKRVHEKVLDGNRLVSDKVREICDGTRLDDGY
jgi:hypothetical protein